jgi:hypothetical protein
MPVEGYQAACACSALLGLLGSPHLKPVHAFPLALFSWSTFLLTVCWVVESHPALVRAALQLKQGGWPIYTILWRLEVLYFGMLALLHAFRMFPVGPASELVDVAHMHGAVS